MGTLQCIQNCEEQWICQMAVLPFRETSDWRNEQSSDPDEVQWRELQSPALGEAQSHAPGGASGWLAAMLVKKLNMTPMCPCSKEVQQLLGCIRTSAARRSREVTLCLSQHWWDHVKSSSGLSSYKKQVAVLKQVQQRAMGVIKRWENLSVREGWDRVVQPGEEKARGRSSQCM